jgi:hypothetical protein
MNLYRHFDKDGRLLYVGVSLNAINRLAEHRASHWFSEIATIKVETFEDRAAASSPNKNKVARALRR